MCINRTAKLNCILPQHLEVPCQVFKRMWTGLLLHELYFYTEEIHPDTECCPPYGLAIVSLQSLKELLRIRECEETLVIACVQFLSHRPEFHMS